MKKIFNVLVVCVLIFGCDSNNDINELKAFCSINNPTEDLVWLKNEIEQREQNISDFSNYFYIYQSTSLSGEEIIIYADCCPFCDTVSPVHNCTGEIIGYLGDENFSFELLNKGQIIWKTKDFECEL